MVIYIISTAVRSGLPDGLVFWVCHGVVRLVTSNSYIYYFHGREVGFTRRFGILGLPRCREVGFIQRSYINSTAVRSGLPTVYHH